jgi:nanoRNase/pAp phosphatase (c-di-AMP/oligoRNAs hydrolase)
MMELIDHCRNIGIDQIMQLPDVLERSQMYFEHAEKFKAQIKRCSTMHAKLVVLDLREEEIIYAGNRFMIYALHPEANISIHVLWGLKQQNTVFATGKSIINRTAKTDIGDLMHRYAGGGHANAGTCQIENERAAQVLQELVTAITSDEEVATPVSA